MSPGLLVRPTFSGGRRTGPEVGLWAAVALPPLMTPRTLPLVSVIALHAGPDPAGQRVSALAVSRSQMSPGRPGMRSVGGFLPLLAPPAGAGAELEDLEQLATYSQRTRFPGSADESERGDGCSWCSGEGVGLRNRIWILPRCFSFVISGESVSPEPSFPTCSHVSHGRLSQTPTPGVPPAAANADPAWASRRLRSLALCPRLQCARVRGPWAPEAAQ